MRADYKSARAGKCQYLRPVFFKYYFLNLTLLNLSMFELQILMVSTPFM